MTLLRDSKDGEGSIINPRSIFRMGVEREKAFWCITCFKPKVQRHQDFDKWAQRTMGNPDTIKMFDRFGIWKPLTQARTLSINR